MPARLPYAKLRLLAALERFLEAPTRSEKIRAARWVSAWAHFNELHSPEALRRRMLQQPALKPFVSAQERMQTSTT